MGDLLAVKVVIAGGFGVGKTTFVGSVSEIPPFTTEAPVTPGPPTGPGPTPAGRGKTTTTVAMDFARRTVDGLVLYLFGAPAQDRFWFMWDGLVSGAAGAVVLLDTRSPAEAFPAIDFFETRGVPFVVAVNEFDGAVRHPDATLREALALAFDVPLVTCDARREDSVLSVLSTAVDHAFARAHART